jgi:septal ring factor EnvC (AmiA/AmiB activator)
MLCPITLLPSLQTKSTQHAITWLDVSLLREKETHLKHLRNLEEELDAQVAHIETKAREEARAKFELEKRNIQEKMEAETAELQAHLRLFQKVNSLKNKLNNTLYFLYLYLYFFVACIGC